MTTAQLPVTTANETSVATYVERIKVHLNTATFAWKQIAGILSAAADEFGQHSDKMKSLCKQTSFSKSKVSKLIQVENCKRLKKHDNLFAQTTAWTVLYEATKLTDEQFANLVASIEPGSIVSQSHVNACKTKEISIEDPYKTVFSIQIDLNAIKTSKFTSTDYEELKSAMETLQNTLNHVRISETSVLENDAAEFLKEIEHEYHRVVRKEIESEKKTYIKCASDKTRFGGYSKAELNQMIREKDYEAVFDTLGSDRFDQERFYRSATDAVYEKRLKKYSSKLRPSEEYANTEIKIAA